MMRYRNKTVFVTGAAGGIGRSLCLAFAAEGATVIACDVDGPRVAEAAEEIKRTGGRALALTADISDELALRIAVDSAIEGAGEIDVLINNAGIAYGNIYQLMTIPTAELRRLLEVNVLGMLFCARACHQSLKRCGGVIINMSSMASYMANGAYSLSKAAVNNLTITLADELANDGVRVNGIAPGLVASPQAMQHVNESFQQRIRRAQLVPRQGEMADVTKLALFLASDDASFISGQTLLVDGGFLRHSARAMPVPLDGLPND